GGILAWVAFVVAMMWTTLSSADPGVAINVDLTPAGSFIARTSKVQGYAYQNGDAVVAENIVVDLNSLTTGISLRDKHTKERLLVKKFPKAKLIKATGKNGKGTALIQVKGKKQKVEGTYTVKGKTLKASFPMHLPDLGINDVRYMGVGVRDKIVVDIEVPLQDAPKRSTAGKKKRKR